MKVTKYNDPRKLKKKEILVDPGVYELTKATEYSMIDLLHKLASERLLLDNEWISIDYPCDMNKKHSQEFIDKSVENNVMYKDYNKYICTIQFHYHNSNSFIYRAEEIRDIWSKDDKIVGIGNMCRILRTSKNHMQFLDNVFEYIKTEMRGKRVHFYGLARQLIIKYIPRLENKKITVSIDSTKWTRNKDDEDFTRENGIVCRKHNRDEFFLRYIKYLKGKKINAEY